MSPILPRDILVINRNSYMVDSLKATPFAIEDIATVTTDHNVHFN